MTINKAYVNELVQALNSTCNGIGGKYPIGNKPLTERAASLEFAGVIAYDKINCKWAPNAIKINNRENKQRITK